MNSAALRTLMIYAVVLPLAVFIGWMAVDLANWDRTSFAVMAMIVFVLLTPLLLKWHYPVLLFSWNTYITVFFLPGQPGLWMLMAGINFGMAILHRIIEKRPAFLPARSIAFTLLVLAAIVYITATLRGGMGLQSLGGASVGGRGYYYIFAAIIGYFALTSQPIPPEKRNLYLGVFLLGALLPAMSTLIYLAGPAFYFLFLIFPVGFAAVQAGTESSAIVRVVGIATAAASLVYWLLARHGVRGLLTKWWRVGLLLVAVALTTMGGYRSNLAFIILFFMLLFVTEGLLRSPIFPALLLCSALALASLIPIADKLPSSMQRSISFVPMIEVDPMVQHDARASWEWRKLMWQAMWPDLPNYLWIGKGYALNPTEIYLADQAARRGKAAGYSGYITTGDYHNGALSVYVPFGSFGMLAFIAFLVVGLRALYRNLRYGPEELRTHNRFFFTFFLAKAIFFFALFGSLASDLYQFTGILGFAVALNHGVHRQPALAAAPQVAFRRQERRTIAHGAI